MDRPLFSIIIPTFNRGSLIERTVLSVLQQSYSNFELLVIDDGSTDNTKSVIESIEDDRLSYHYQDNHERAYARNHGVLLSKGEYVTFLDSDDVFYKEHLSLAAEHIIKAATPVFWSPYDIIDAKGNIIEPYINSGNPVIEDLIEKGNILSCHGVFIARSVALEVRFNEERALSGSEDMELWLRLGARFEIKRLKQVTNALVHHQERSVLNFDSIEKLVRRKDLMVEGLMKDQEFMNKYGHRMDSIRSRAYSYVSIHAMCNSHIRNGLGWKYFLKSLRQQPRSLFSRRSLAIVKHGLFNS